MWRYKRITTINSGVCTDLYRRVCVCVCMGMWYIDNEPLFHSIFVFSFRLVADHNNISAKFRVNLITLILIDVVLGGWLGISWTNMFFAKIHHRYLCSIHAVL